MGDLDRVLPGNTPENRAEMLRKVTDLFVEGAERYSEAEVGIFDQVMVRLVREMEEAVRAAVAVRLAKIRNAPRNLMCALAADDAIDVAGPALRYSERLDDPTLMATARSCSQQHLLAISLRKTVSEDVSDVLIERGDRMVTLSTVNNAGVRFSPASHAILVARSKDDDELAAGVWSRTDIPRRDLLRLFSIASDNVRRRLEAADRGKTRFIRDMMTGVTNDAQDRMRAASRDYAQAYRRVAELRRAGLLDVNSLEAFADARQFDETTVALAILCDLPIGVCERAMAQDRPELLLMFARAIELSWDATKAILYMRAGAKGIPQLQLDQYLSGFSRIKPDTARKALQFVRLRERAAIAPEPTAYH